MTRLRPSGRGRRAWLGLAALGLFAAQTAVADDDVTALAKRLAELRGQVDDLALRLSAKSAESKDLLRSMARQRAELELEAKREETRLAKIGAAMAERRSEVEAEKQRSQKLVPLLEASLERVRGYIRQGLPFRSQERLAAVDKIEEQHRAGLMSPARALSRLWSFVEDELRLTRESGLYRQTVSIDGQERLAEVLRIGTLMLYYKTDDGAFGKATREADQWVFRPLDDPNDQRLLLEAFDSFKKQIRVGYFELPNALPRAASESGGRP